jgi:SHAQKYF class myb-like DNA-binding protein
MEEHALFLEGLRSHGKGWKQIAAMIQSRSVVQIRTHAQKYFQKLSKAQSQNGGNAVGEVFMDTRPNGTDGASSSSSSSSSSTSSSNLANLALLDLDTDMMGSQTKTSSKSKNRKPKTSRGNSPPTTTSSSSSNATTSGVPSPRRKRKIEAGELAAGINIPSSSSSSNSSMSNNRKTINGSGQGKRVGISFNKPIDPSSAASSLSTTPGSVADPLLMGLDGLGVPSGWYGHHIQNGNGGSGHVNDGLLSQDNRISIDPLHHQTQSHNSRHNSRLSGGLSIPSSHGFEGTSIFDGLHADLDFFDVSRHVENHITSDDHHFTQPSPTGEGIDDFSSGSDDNKNHGHQSSSSNNIGHSNSTETDGSSEEEGIFYGNIDNRKSSSSSNIPQSGVNVRPPALTMPVPEPPPAPPVLSHPALSPCIAPANGFVGIRPKGSNHGGGLNSWTSNISGRKTFTGNSTHPPPLSFTQQPYVPNMTSSDLNTRSQNHIHNNNNNMSHGSLAKCTSFDSDMGPSFQESFTALDLHVFEDIDENEFDSHEFLVDEDVDHSF